MIKESSMPTFNRCPHCNDSQPVMQEEYNNCATYDGLYHTDEQYAVTVLQCAKCKKRILVQEKLSKENTEPQYFPPESDPLDGAIPALATNFLKQAIATRSEPDACVVMCASALQAMFEAKGLKEGSLNDRIEKASKQHLITPDMAEWAHHIRLEANDSRHLNRGEKTYTETEARQCVEFARALAEILFVLPARVPRGRREAEVSKMFGVKEDVSKMFGSLWVFCQERSWCAAEQGLEAATEGQQMSLAIAAVEHQEGQQLLTKDSGVALTSDLAKNLLKEIKSLPSSGIKVGGPVII